MFTQRQALKLLKKYIKDRETIKHSIGASKFAFRLAKKILEKRPHMQIDPEKVRVATLLHDIGKEKRGMHELNSIKILKMEGLAEISKLVLHGYVYEKSILKNNPDKRLVPKTIENKIVAYSDFRFRGKILTLKERLDDIRERKKNIKLEIQALSLSEKRYYEMEEELLKLTN